jgi:hypothetical protein
MSGINTIKYGYRNTSGFSSLIIIKKAASIIEYVKTSDMSATHSLKGKLVFEYTYDASQIHAEITRVIRKSLN